MRRTPIGMINTVLCLGLHQYSALDYTSTLPWITPVLCLDYTSTLPRVLRYSRLSTGVLSREYCHKDRVLVSHKDRHFWIASLRGWYLLFHPDVFYGANHDAGGTTNVIYDLCCCSTNIKCINGAFLVYRTTHRATACSNGATL